MKRILLAASALSLVAGAAIAAPTEGRADRSAHAQVQPMQLAQNDRRGGDRGGGQNRGGAERGGPSQQQPQPAAPQQAQPAQPAQPNAQGRGGRSDRGANSGPFVVPGAQARPPASPAPGAQPQAASPPAARFGQGRGFNPNVSTFPGRGQPAQNNPPAQAQQRGPQGGPPNGQNGRGPQGSQNQNGRGPQGSPNQNGRGPGRDGGRVGAAPNNRNWDTSRYGRPVFRNGVTERSRDQGRNWYSPNNWRPSYRAPRIYTYRDWRPPSGFYLRSWSYGDILPFGWYDPPYYLNWAQYGLEIPPIGCEWVRSGSDALLVDIWSGEVLSVEYNLFYY